MQPIDLNGQNIQIGGTKLTERGIQFPDGTVQATKAGKVGPPGAQGGQGIKGYGGTKDDRGNTGFQGDTGATGPQGIAGFTSAISSVPKTGQTKCYETDDLASEIPCGGTGQDGDLQRGFRWPTPRFTDNGNGTVTNNLTGNLTGLIWLNIKYIL